MKKFWIDYDATIVIEAETAEEAKGIFCQCFLDNTKLDTTVTTVEEIPEEESGFWNASNTEEGWC